MFDALSNRLTDVFDRLKKRGALSNSDVDAAMRDIRVALLEADVALPVVKDFIDAFQGPRPSANASGAIRRPGCPLSLCRAGRLTTIADRGYRLPSG